MFDNKNGAGGVSSDAHEESRYKKIRIREVDLQKVEGPHLGQSLGRFEREVLEKLGTVPSPLENWIQREEQRRERRRVRRKMSRLLLKAGITARQTACYRALFVDELTLEEAAKKMGLTERRIRYLHQSIMMRLQALAIKQSTTRKLGRLLKESGTRQERSVWQLHYRRGLSAKQIARQLHISERRVYCILEDLQAQIADP